MSEVFLILVLFDMMEIVKCCTVVPLMNKKLLILQFGYVDFGIDDFADNSVEVDLVENVISYFAAAVVLENIVVNKLVTLRM